MAYESYKLLHSHHLNFRDKMMSDKKAQVEFLYKTAMDREDDCTLDGNEFTESPRIFDRKIKTNYYQSLTCETINIGDRFRSGNILFYDGNYWICTSSFVFHNLYCKGNFIKCNYKLKWQTETGDIIEKYCFTQSAAQYNSGESGNNIITLGSDQMLVVLPKDQDTIFLDSPTSFFIDWNKKSPTVYQITRNDTVPYSDWDFGCISLIVTQGVITEMDNIDLGICDYHSPTPVPSHPDETTDLSALISCKGSEVLKAGGNAKTFLVSFTDAAGDPVNDVQYTWEASIADEFKDCLAVEILPDNRCRLKVSYDTLIVGNSVKLEVKDMDGKEIAYKIIEIGGGL